MRVTKPYGAPPAGRSTTGAVAGKSIYAYTKEEWGIGASSGGGDHNLIRSFNFSLLMMMLTAPASLACLAFGVLALFRPVPIMALVMVFFGVLFGLAVIQCWVNVHGEWLGRKARKLNGLPKPW